MMRATWILGLSFSLLAACGGSDDSNFDTTEPDGGIDGSMSTGGRSGGTGGRDAGSGTGGSATGGTGPTECGDVMCTAPAVCADSGSTPKCACPAGYEDTNGDGSKCDDIDECTEGTDDCADNSTCENNEGGFDCVCDDGFTDVDGECLKDNLGTCGDADECASGNCVGGVCCAETCDSPGACEELDGTVCVNGDTCEYGKLADDTDCSDACTTGACFDGECIVTDAKDCSDNDACTNDVCDPATGDCSHPTTDCDDNNPCTNDACGPLTGCLYTNNNTASCTDDDPCTTDVCRQGACRSTPLDCSSMTDDCNEGVCNAGTCEAQPANEDGACTQGLVACDATGSCNASGSCVGDDDACGNLATACTTCSGGGSCTQGRQCTCRAATGQEPPIIVDTQAGICKFNTDECDQNPCASIATCNDPSSASGDVVCTCPSGYTGNGKGASGCVDINECTQDPCGIGKTATNGCNGTSPPGSYSCNCKAGYTSIQTATGPTCVCGLGGTYAMYTVATATYDPVMIGPFEVLEGSGGGLEFYSWSLRYHQVQANGTMTVTTIPCGGSTPTVCSTLNMTALAQYQDSKVWGKASINDGFAPINVSLQGVVQGAGASYVEPQTVVTSGISLANPAGAWPPCAACINVPANQTTCTCADGQHTITNRAFWDDSDGNGSGTGVSTYAVLAGGLAIGSGAHDPPFDYTTSECPRLSAGGPWPYAAWPGLSGGFFFTHEWDGASRVTSRVRSTQITYSGQQCVINGNITGPQSGRALTEGRVRTCYKCGSAGCDGSTRTECDQGAGPNDPHPERDFYDTVDQTQQINSANFQLRRVDSGTNAINLGPILAMTNETNRSSALNAACQAVRARFCPAGKVCAP